MDNQEWVKIKSDSPVDIGQGNCPFLEFSGTKGVCGIKGNRCDYGITEIKVPDYCPLKKGVKVIVEADEEPVK